MIFHAPFALDPKAKAASGIRPVRMKEAFVEAGYEVFDLTGTARTRRDALKKLRALLAQGVKFDFCYSESATIPNAVAGKKHFPPHFFLEAKIFATCSRANIPVGLFYRDIYWAFADYKQSVGKILAFLMTRLYRFDLRVYRRFVSRLYLPSLLMGEHLVISNPETFCALPPGAALVDTTVDPSPLRLLYVGALGGHYRLDEVFSALRDLPGVEMIVCTGKQGWEAQRDSIELPPNVRVVHESGQGLEKLYKWANAGLLFMRPDPYRQFAAPMKLYEYVGHAKPVIASAGTLVAEFVGENQVGWVAPYKAQSLKELLDSLVSNPQLITEVTKKVEKARHHHTWLARARFVAEDLTGVKRDV
ncbi:glycosyltransferase [Actinomycetaceae bacterium TAE3-ERU4]|nr:glycosyltransferase [Actinomycetaceae bacterium TAE3-ERU4]